MIIRSSLAANAANVLLDLKPDGGMELLARQSTGASTRVVSSGTAAIGMWLRLVRNGTTLTGYTSRDGTRWTAIGATSIGLGQNVYVGVVVCSHTTGALNTATFDNIAATRLKAQPRRSSITYRVVPSKGW